MKEILNSASIMAFPSTYEGFGIPVLEAMAAGIPVVAAQGTPAANLLGEDSLTVKHDDDEAWSLALNKLLNDKDLRDRLVFEGFKQANKYTYQNSAQQLLETWHQLITIRRK
jgi:glycosyltransferase involved in cell wall biosynthesis